MSDLNRAARPPWGTAVVVVGTAILLFAIAVPNFIKARTTAAYSSCINHLRQIDGAKDQWAIEKGKQTGDMPGVDEVLLYMTGNNMPVCPEGGTYVFNKIGEPPTCTLGSSNSTNAWRHKLQQD